MDISKHRHKNNFDRLPDDIVLFIFNKLWGAQWLCRCSVVSKRFASLVPHINNVSVTLSRYHAWSIEEEVTSPVFNYLVGLKELMHLHIETHFCCAVDWKHSWSPHLKWKVNFNTNVRSFTFLMANFLIRAELPPAEDEGEDEEKEDEEEDEEEEIQNEMYIRQDAELDRFNMALACFADSRMKLNIVLDMIKKHQMLRGIMLTDTMKEGKIVVFGNQIAELRNLERAKLSTPKVDSDGVEFLVKCCHLPSLHLPKSKLLMNSPSLLYIRCVNSSSDDEGDDVIDEDMLAGSYDDDKEGVYSEAVEEILAKHKNKMSTAWVT